MLTVCTTLYGLTMSIPQLLLWSPHLALETPFRAINALCVKVSCTKARNHLNLGRAASVDNRPAVPEWASGAWFVRPSAWAPSQPGAHSLPRRTGLIMSRCPTCAAHFYHFTVTPEEVTARIWQFPKLWSIVMLLIKMRQINLILLCDLIPTWRWFIFIKYTWKVLVDKGN